MTTESSSPIEADHLCVLVHGLWGNPGHLTYVHDALRVAFPLTRLHLLNCARNSGPFTYDGIELGGERVAHEIEEALATLGPGIRRLSVVGYSLGGLVARYAVGLLDHRGWFAPGKLAPVNFVTFASPHLGVRTPLKGWHNRLWNGVGGRMLSISGRQLFLIDEFRDTGRPLLEVMAQPGGVFMTALAKFKRRSLYANVVNDRSAVYYTTGISKTDPYVHIHDLKFEYLKGFEPNIIDTSKPVTMKRDEHPVPFCEWLTIRFWRVVHRMPLILFFTVILPIGTVIFLISSAYQTFRSSRRIKHHNSDKTGIRTGLYKVPLLVDNVRRAAEEAYEHINSAQHEEYLEDEASTPASTSSTAKSRAESSETVVVDKGGAAAAVSGATGGDGGEFPTLALTAGQFAMIDALDGLGWEKYPVYIHRVHHTHAAIIVRMPRPRFDEGKVVVRHFVGTFEA